MCDLKNYVRGHRVEHSRRNRVFDYPGERHWGFSFPLDMYDKPVLKWPESYRNYARCLQSIREADGYVIDRGIETEAWDYWESAHGSCPECRAEVWLDDPRGLGVRCECGVMYNMGGSKVSYIDEAGFEAQGGYLNAGERW